jgi:hypothetical protein
MRHSQWTDPDNALEDAPFAILYHKEQHCVAIRVDSNFVVWCNFLLCNCWIYIEFNEHLIASDHLDCTGPAYSGRHPDRRLDGGSCIIFFYTHRISSNPIVAAQRLAVQPAPTPPSGSGMLSHFCSQITIFAEKVKCNLNVLPVSLIQNPRPIPAGVGCSRKSIAWIG